MSRDGSIDLSWGDGEHRFRLPIGQLRELEEKRGAGSLQILERLMGRRDVFGNLTSAPAWRVDDVRETIRLGLIGGGMPASDALKLVDRYMDEWPRLESAAVALQVLDAAMSGGPEIVGKEPAGEDPTAEEMAAASTSPASTATGPRSATRRKKSTA